MQANLRGLIAACDVDACALESPGRAPLNYGALGALLDRFAARLSALGVERRHRLAVVLPQGPELATCLYATLSFAACVPLNPSLTTTEYSRLLISSQASALIVPLEGNPSAEAAAREQSLPVYRLHRLDAAGDFDLEDHSLTEERMPVRAPPAGAASLVLHTSGTTSAAKVVALTRANLMACVRNLLEALELRASDRYLSILPIFHIAGIGVLLASWSAGSCVVCPSAFQGSQLLPLIDAHSPTWFTAVPTLLEALLARAPNDYNARSRSLRFIRSSAAPLRPSVHRELEARLGVPVIEAYGMTETTSQIAANPLPPRARKVGSVGLPVHNEVAILDSSRRPLEANQDGEIVVRGPNVADGYESLADPGAGFCDGWFHTGDVGHLDADGYLFITGRIKELINVGGEKVAPAEVEEALQDHPAVARAAAFAIEDERLGESVGAAVELREGRTVSEDELRRFASETLALFKIPVVVRVVSKLPMTPTGKLRRVGLAQALDIVPLRLAGTHVFCAPRTPREVVLCEIWQRALRLERVGIDDNFFRLGGDSLAATTVLAEASARFGSEIGYLDLLASPTVRALAQTIPQLPDGASARRATGPVHGSSRGSYPLTLEQSWFYRQPARGSSAYRLGRSIHLCGALDAQRLCDALEAIVARHAVLGCRYLETANDVQQVPSNDWHPERCDVADDDELVRVERMIWKKDFNLAVEAPFRATLLRRSPDEHVLILAAHHIAFDAISWRVLFDELRTLYSGDALAAPTVDYLGFAEWQDGRSREGAFEESFDYWRANGSHAFNMASRIQKDLPSAPYEHLYSMASHSLVLDEEALHKLRASARSAETTRYTLALTAFMAALQPMTGNAVAIATPFRNRLAPANVIGVFNQILSLSISLEGLPSSSAAGALDRVQRALQEVTRYPQLPPSEPARVLPVLFVYNLRLPPSPTLGAVRTSFRPVGRDLHHRQIVVMATDADDSLRFDFGHAKSLFREETIASLVRRFDRNLDALSNRDGKLTFE